MNAELNDTQGAQAAASSDALVIRDLGMQAYEPVWKAMQTFTDQRKESTPDELWLLQHPPVFTLGQAAKPEHLLMPGDIPVVPVDRGGQVTYHGPGQLVAYPLLDLTRRQLGVRELVTKLEQVVIDVLAMMQIQARRRDGMPGVYIEDAKIASLGLRVRRGKSFHGLAFNIDMDLEPFSRINPCGFAGLEVIDIQQINKNVEWLDVQDDFSRQLLEILGYTNHIYTKEQPALLVT